MAGHLFHDKVDHEAVILGSEILAGTCLELLQKPELLGEIQEEFRSAKERSVAQ